MHHEFGTQHQESGRITNPAILPRRDCAALQATHCHPRALSGGCRCRFGGHARGVGGPRRWRGPPMATGSARAPRPRRPRAWLRARRPPGPSSAVLWSALFRPRAVHVLPSGTLAGQGASVCLLAGGGGAPTGPLHWAPMATGRPLVPGARGGGFSRSWRDVCVTSRRDVCVTSSSLPSRRPHQA